MSYMSIDELQKALSTSIFSDRQDVKKAAGRALGTLVELITFYLLREWGLGPTISIELSVPEFGNPKITHNVEFGIHPIISSTHIYLNNNDKTITSNIICKAYGNQKFKKKSTRLLSKDKVQRNACIFDENNDYLFIANIISEMDENFKIQISKLKKNPFAIVECKRVGVEEGAKKGPTTIEKAKQGAYVAKHVSALQKIRKFDGELFSARAKPDGTITLQPWKEEIKRLVYDCNTDELDGFVMTIGIVSNHGNWFTSDDPNKELLVLKQSYDWLLFLNDLGIAEFVNDTIMSSNNDMKDIKEAFHKSYTSGKSGSNQFTKVTISYNAHKKLSEYFHNNISHIESSWFSVLSPRNEIISTLRDELEKLRDKDWR